MTAFIHHFPSTSSSPPFLLPNLLVHDDMPTASVTLLDGSDVPHDNPAILPAILTDPHTHDQDVHDIDIHASTFSTTVPDTVSVLSIHDPFVYYSSFPDCSTFSHPFPPYHYLPQDAHIPHPDSHFVLHNDPNPAFVHNSTHMSPKHLHHTQDLALRAPSSLHDSRFHSSQSPPSLAFLPPLHDLACPADHATHSFVISSSPPKPPGHAHTLLPPIVQSNPADLGASSTSQVDPCAAAFLRDQLGEAKWNTFSARLFERRLGPIKSKIRVRSKNPNEDPSPPSGATAIDFLVKVEVVKEVLRTYVPHPYNPLKSLTHLYSHSPSGSVTLTRSTILVLSGWSNTQFSYWARRAEGISVLATHDERLHAVAVALQKRINAGGVLLDGVDETEIYSTEGCPSVTGKGLDIIVEEVKKRTGLSPFLRGKHSSLDPFGSTNSDKDAGPGPPQGVPTAPIYMPTFQAMEYSHPPAITASAESPIGRRPKKKRRISVADSVSSYGSSSALKVDPSDEPTNRNSLLLADNPRLTPDQESVSSSDMQPISPPSTIMLPQLLGPPRVDENGLSPYELSSHRMHSMDDGRPEYFPVSNSRSDLDNSDSENFPRKRYSGLTERKLEKRHKLSA
ncbi:hypothetical protein J3R82DRAFT_5907 [Butyriboletus roseoflavus]|nr:hypothetical protein J3R82DRAFT_5907 [Butyriboletus roseoflavus]